MVSQARKQHLNAKYVILLLAALLAIISIGCATAGQMLASDASAPSAQPVDGDPALGEARGAKDSRLATLASPTAAKKRPTPTPQRTRRPTPTAQVRSHSGLSIIRYRDLPKEAKQTIQLIDQGGPFPFERDGITFQNRERILPRKPAGYYREYTVITPGSRDRGARRIISGAEGELYYTDDHYESFREVVR